MFAVFALAVGCSVVVSLSSAGVWMSIGGYSKPLTILPGMPAGSEGFTVKHLFTSHTAHTQASVFTCSIVQG